MFLSPLGPPVDVSPLALLLFGEARLPDGTRVHTTQGFSSGCPDHCHNAWDVGMPVGTPLRAQHAGTVSAAGESYGNCGIQVAIDGMFGFRTRSCHLSAVTVSTGSKVSKGDIIGFSGATGNVTGPHWHGQDAFCSSSSCGPLHDPRVLLAASEVAGWLLLAIAAIVTTGALLS